MIIENSISNSVVEEACYGSSVLEKVKSADYQLIILDVSMPKTDSAVLVTDLLTVRPDCRILIFSMFNEDIYAKRFLQIGAMGYFNKAAAETEIIKAVENVLDDKKYVSSGLLESITHDIFTEKFSNPFERLSKREIEILHGMVKGKGVADISDELDIDTSTVGTYKARIFKKLHCTTTAEINLLADLHNFTKFLQE